MFKEYHVERTVPWFDEYVKRTTDLPFLVTLREREGAHVADRFLRASDLGDPSEYAEWKTVLIDGRTGDPVVPNGSIGYRWGEDGAGKWNLELGDVDPALTLLGRHDELVEIDLPRFDVGPAGGETLRRGVPARLVGGVLVTTVFDLLAAQLGIHREGLPGTWPSGYDDASEPYTPAWQETITGVDAARVTRVAREFARNAERSNGRSMIVLGAGTNHWFHSDQVYRAILQLVALCGCQGVNGGGWAHYVGQEKVRPISGWSTLAFALDWNRPPRQQATTPFWFLASDQFRYQRTRADVYSTPLGKGALDGMHVADCNALAARLGWMPSYPTFDRNPLDLTRDAAEAGMEAPAYVVDRLKTGELRFAAEDPDAPENFPRVLTLWRANLLGSSSKGHEYFLRHLLGVEDAAVRNTESTPEERPTDVVWRDEAPTGKFDLFTTIDFRMNGSALYSDVVLPAATWYEKHDLSSTDLHPFVHSFNQAVPPPWEAKTDFDIFGRIAERFSQLAEKHLGTRTDLVAAPLQHDTPDELAQPLGEVRDWKRGECEPVPGKTMPKLVPVERDFTAVYRKWRSLGPLAEQLGSSAKGIPLKPTVEIDELRAANGELDGRPALTRDVHMCEAILALSGVTNGRLAVEGFRGLEKRTGTRLADIAEEHADVRITFGDTQVQPRKVLASPEWSGMESRDRRYNPFTINVERAVPFRTLTGRQQLYVEHVWMLEYGEGLPTYRPPLNVLGVVGEQLSGDPTRKELHLRWLSPHSKWSIHSEFQDNLHMLTLFRGGPVVWISDVDAAEIEVADNDWVEVFNRNGVVIARAVVSHRIPSGVGMMYHSQDRHVNVPRSELSGTRGGTDNSVTRISMKPTHLVGGYAQLSYGFNYYGPCGTQRDEMVAVRKLRGKVVY